MEHREGTLHGALGLELFYQSWHPQKDPRAVIAVTHGFAEHGGRYANLVDFLVVRGYAIFALDLRGFGRSAGPRGHIDRWSQYREDIRAFLQKAREEKPEHPLFLYGHSMGGLIALDYALRHPEGLAGVIASAPGLEPVGVAKAHLVAIARLLSRIWPRFSLDLGLDAPAISRDPEVVEAYLNDPLRQPRGTVRWGTESLATIDWIKSHAEELKLPLLMVHGGADRIAAPQGSRAFFDQVRFEDKELHIYEGVFHEAHNDFGRERVLEDLASWLGRHLV